METPERVYKSTHSDANCAESDTSSAIGEVKDVTNDIVEAVYYTPSTNRESQIRQHVRVRQNKTTQLKVDWEKSRNISKITGQQETIH